MKGNLNDNFLKLFFTVYRKCQLFQFVSRAIGMDIPILTGVQNRYINHWKNSYILPETCSFLCLFSKLKVACIPIAYFTFHIFIVNAFFLMSSVN